MADIFGYQRNPKPRGVFSTENSLLTFGGTNVGSGGNGSAAIGYLVQNWQTDYQQNVQEIFEIGTNALYWAKGRPQGAGSVGRIVGMTEAIAGNPGVFFPAEAYDICKGGARVEITAAGGHCAGVEAGFGLPGGKQVTIAMDGVIVTGIGFTMQVQDIQLNERINWRFAYMEIKSQ